VAAGSTRGRAEVASPIAVKGPPLAAAALMATTLRHSIFAFLARDPHDDTPARLQDGIT